MPAPSSSSSSSSSGSKNPLRGAVEILHGKLYYAALSTPPSRNKITVGDPRDPSKKLPLRCFNIDEDLVYWNFFRDFGPLNLGQLYRFTARLNRLLQLQQQKELELMQQHSHAPEEADGDARPAAILFWSSTHPSKRANAIYLICAWQVLELRRSPEDALRGFAGVCPLPQQEKQIQKPKQSSDWFQRKSLDPPAADSEEEEVDERTTTTTSSSSSLLAGSRPPPQPLTSIGKATVAPLPPFHDASPIACTYDLSVLHCLQGLVQARKHGFFDFATFDVEEYEHFEQVENGDLNWICKDKILAFAGPSFTKTVSREGYCTLAPSDYIPYFKSKKVGLVVRLNKRNYEEQDFIDAGINHLEQFYLDGSCPPMSILRTVLAAFEAVPPGKAFAVHCKAGLGRTGTCIGAYLMKHYRMTAAETIAWMRICRPGMVIGPQQQFLRDLEPVMWQEGAARNIARGLPSPAEAEIEASHSTEEVVGGSGKRKKKATAVHPHHDAATGRPGQADGLLNARRQRTTPKASTPSRKPHGGAPAAVPVTPESSASGSDEHFPEDDVRPPPSWVHAST